MFSVPWNNLTIFFLCVRGINTPIIIAKIIKASCCLCNKNITIRGTAIAVVIDDKDTYPESKNTEIKIPKLIKNNMVGNNAMITPTIVATPLPPLNPTYIGKICPNTAASANIRK